MTRAQAGAQRVELHGPTTGGWHTTMTRDWIALCPDLSPTAFRLYCVCRSLIIDKYGDVRKLSLNDLRELLPGVGGKPNSLTRVRDAIAELTNVGLFTAPEGERITTSSRAKASGTPLRIQIHDMPPAHYKGWRNAFDKLNAIQAGRTSDASIEPTNEGCVAAPSAGRISDPVPAVGRKSDPGGRKNDPRGRKSDPDSPLTCRNAARNEVFEVSSSPPPAASVPGQRSDEPVRGGGGDAAQQEDEHQQAARTLVDSLDYGTQLPSKAQRLRLLQGVAQALNCGWTPDQLTKQLFPGDGVQSKLAIYLHRLQPGQLPDPPTPPVRRTRTYNRPKCSRCGVPMNAVKVNLCKDCEADDRLT